MRLILHSIVVIFLSLLTQIGGLAWLFALLTQRRLLAFLTAYALLSVASLWIAPLFGRVPLECSSNGTLQMRSIIYCILNRQYVTPDTRTVAQDLANHMSARFPGTVTQALDGGFPYLDGFPMLPHLSHNDGRKLDLAFYYRDDKAGYLPGRTPSPIGYFAFEEGTTGCSPNWLSLRWDLPWLQAMWPSYQLDRNRTKVAVTWLANDTRVEKLFLEPHLKQSMNVNLGKVRFQGCRAARHDDHIHFQVW